jgi:hypothetical protein
MGKMKKGKGAPPPEEMVPHISLDAPEQLNDVIGRGSEVNWPLTPNQHYQFGLLIFPTSDSRFAWVSK